MELICKHCSCIVSLDSARMTENGDIICSRCARELYIKCSTCNNYIPLSCNRTICQACDSIVYTKAINNYSLKPIPRFKGKKYSTDTVGRYFGIEMEYNRVTPESAFIIFNNLYKDKWLYNKHDGSIAGGVEIVTNPLDKSKVKELLTLMSPGLEAISKVRGYTDNAGIHIHVNRKSIDPLDIYKLSYLLNYRSTQYDKRIIYYIAGRNKTSTNSCDSYHYAKVGSLKKKKQIINYSDIDRYVALNLRNANTIEFRIFMASADPNIINMYVDFVDDLIEYAHTHSIKEMNIPTFINWELTHTSNSIIINRIKNFQRHNGKVDSHDNIYKISINDLKGIHVDRYKDILNYLKYCGCCDDIMEVIDWVRRNNSPYPGISRDNVFKYGSEIGLSRVLENTLRKVLISKITKGIKECA